MKCRLLTDKSYSESVQSPAVHFRLRLSLSCESPVWQVEIQGGEKPSLNFGECSLPCVLMCRRWERQGIFFLTMSRLVLFHIYTETETTDIFDMKRSGKTTCRKSYLPITVTQMFSIYD